MKNAFADELSHGLPVVILGTDSPSLPPALVDAFAALAHKDVVIGPACDGGYYLLGLNHLHPSLFPVDMDWGTSSVLWKTLSEVRLSQLSLELLPFWYDVDRPEDLDLLRQHLPVLADQNVPVPPRTQARLLRTEVDET